MRRSAVPTEAWFKFWAAKGFPGERGVFKLWMPPSQEGPVVVRYIARMNYEPKTALFDVANVDESASFINYEQAVDYLLELHHRNTINFALAALGIKP